MTGPRYRHANGASDLHSAPRRWRRGWGTSFGGGERCVPPPGRLIGRSAPETDPAASGRGRLLDCQPPPTGRLLDCQLPPTGKGRGALGVVGRGTPSGAAGDATRPGAGRQGRRASHPSSELRRGDDIRPRCGRGCPRPHAEEGVACGAKKLNDEDEDARDPERVGLGQKNSTIK